MELTLSICLGIGLAAACGFRVFVPLLAMSLATMAGHLELSPEFAWVGTWPAFACLLTATVLEVVAYYVPWLDNLLDSLATPAAVVAGTIVTAAVVTDMSPLMKWSLALIAGGGTAGIIQTATVAVRGASSLSTGGLGNSAVATTELAASLGTSALSMFVPVLTTLVVAMFVATLLTLVWRRPWNAPHVA